MTTAFAPVRVSTSTARPFLGRLDKAISAVAQFAIKAVGLDDHPTITDPNSIWNRPLIKATGGHNS